MVVTKCHSCGGNICPVTTNHGGHGSGHGGHGSGENQPGIRPDFTLTGGLLCNFNLMIKKCRREFKEVVVSGHT